MVQNAMSNELTFEIFLGQHHSALPAFLQLSDSYKLYLIKNTPGVKKGRPRTKQALLKKM